MLNWIVKLMITSLIFFPETSFYEHPRDYRFDYEEVTIEIDAETRLFGWYLKTQKELKGALLHLHGNAGNISSRLSKVQGWLERGYDVFLLDYRGYGKSTGSIGYQDDLVQDAKAGLEWMIQNKKIAMNQVVFYGESLGSYPAIRLAVEHQAQGLILEAPYTSFKELARKHYSTLPKMMTDCLLKNFEFPNEQWIHQIKIPVLIIHGTLDETCPYDMGEKLFEMAPEPKTFFSVPGAAHNDLPIKSGEDFWQKPYEFLERTHS